jgi:hypothetical protein
VLHGIEHLFALMERRGNLKPGRPASVLKKVRCAPCVAVLRNFLVTGQRLFMVSLVGQAVKL